MAGAAPQCCHIHKGIINRCHGEVGSQEGSNQVLSLKKNKKVQEGAHVRYLHFKNNHRERNSNFYLESALLRAKSLKG